MTSSHHHPARLVALLVLAAIAGLPLGARPAAAAEIASYNGRPEGTWVDGSNRLHTVLKTTSPYDGSTQTDEVTIARHRAGTVELDSTYGSGGLLDVALQNPYSWASTNISTMVARVYDVGITADGTVVVAWHATRGQVLTGPAGAQPPTKNEWTYEFDRLIIDRYTLAGARTSRADVPMPRGSWCNSIYSEYRWDDDFGWVASAVSYCGEDNSTVFPSMDVLANGAVAVPTYSTYETVGGEPANPSSVVVFSSTTGAVLHTTSMPDNRQVFGSVRSVGGDGAVFNTRDWSSSGSTQAPSYVVSGWASATARTLAAGCRLWPGPGTSTARTCPSGSSTVVDVIDAAGATTWSRTIEGLSGIQVVGPQTDGRLALTGRGCAVVGASCDQFDQAALRFGATGSIDRYGAARLFDSATGASEYVWDPPVALAGGAQALAIDRRASSGLAHTTITRLLGSGTPPIPTVPGKPAKPSAVPAPTKATLTWTAPPDGGSPITGYRITPYRNGVAQPVIDTTGTATTREVPGLTNGTGYRFTVAARNAKGLGPASDPSDVVTPADVPGAPTNVAATAARTSATVTWKAPGSDGGSPITGYKVEVIDDGVSLVDISVGKVTSWVVPDLFRGNVYTFRVRAVNAVGTGPPSAASNPVVMPPAAFSNWASAAGRQFSDLLGRPATAAELSTWVPALQSGQKPLGELPAALRTSTDHLANVDPVTRLYSAYLGRIPDRDGLVYWIGKKRRGTALSAISSNFAASTEFARTYGSLSNRQFVELVYDNVLGRPGEPSGMDYWTRQLDLRRKTRGQVMVGFSESSEYRRTQGPRVDVIVLHTFLLGRAPTSSEVADEVADRAGGETVAELAQQLLDSEAYATRVGTAP